MFEGPVPTKTENESVATSYTSERKDYSNSEGRRLLAHINNSSKAPNEPGPVFVTDRSQEFGCGKDDKITRNLVETSREEKQKAAVPALVQASKEHSSSAGSESQTNNKVDK